MTTTTTNVTELLNQADDMMKGGGTAGTVLTTLLDPNITSSPIPPVAPQNSKLFSTYLVSPTYYADTDDVLLIKLVNAKGEPFFINDAGKKLRSLVCSNTQIFLSPYDSETACADECEGYPVLHIVPDSLAEKLFSTAMKGLCTADWFRGLVFVSSVGIQFYYPPTVDSAASGMVYRVAEDSEGRIAAREVKAVATCDYPVPYLLVDECVFTSGLHTVEIVESLAQANVKLIDSLCKLEYNILHAAENFPEELEVLLGQFMGSHSHLVKGMLDLQLQGAQCDDAFVRRQRKNEIDILVRLMMREAELTEDIKKSLEELTGVQKALAEQQKTTSCATKSTTTTGARPARLMIDLAELNKVDEMLSKPISEMEEEDFSPPDSASECSR